MASKLVLDFFGSGVIGQTITIRTGVTFTFVAQRNGIFNVTVGEMFSGASYFKQAYLLDDNFTGQSTVTYAAFLGLGIGRVTIENPDNNFFAGIDNQTNFIGYTLTTTAQQAVTTLDVTVTEATTDKCGKYKLNVNSNLTNSYLLIRFPEEQGLLKVNYNEFPFSIEKLRPLNSVYIRVALWEDDTFIPKLIKSIDVYPPSVLSITSVTVTGTVFGGAVASINATYTVGTQYSLDGVTYQGSREYSGLTQGNYTAYAKDDFGCIVTKDFTVTPEKEEVITVEPYIRIPIHNSIRFAKRIGSTFLNYLSTETPGRGELYSFVHDYLQSDIVRTQFKSSYTENKVFLIDCEGIETEIPITKLSENINRTNIYEGNYKTYKGRVAVYFTAGNIYDPNGTPQAEGHILNGLLPVWYKEGMYIFIEGLGATQIDSIEFDELEEIVFAVTQLDSLGDVANKKITSIHTEHPYEVYEFDVNFNLPEGVYQLRLEYGSEFFLSEIIKVHSELPEEYLTVIWYNNKNNDILYNTGIQQMRRIQWEKYFTLNPKSEKETYDTDTSVELVNSKSFAVYELSFMAMPMEVARGLIYGFDNSSSIVINGAVFVCEGGVKVDPIGPLYSFTAELTLTDQTMRGQQVLSNVIDASFLKIEQDASGTGYLMI
jgi:hypothetical protein